MNPRAIATLLLGINLLLISFAVVSQVNRTPRFLTVMTPKPIEDEAYSFKNPTVANKILKQLDVFSLVPVLPKSAYNTSKLSYDTDYEYCDNHREFIVDHPEVIFNENNFVTNYWDWHKLRTQVIPQYGKDVSRRLPISVSNKIPVPLHANLFVTHSPFFNSRQVGSQFSCLSQASNHIAGHDMLYRKDRASQALVDYAGFYENNPQCFSFDKYFPKTFVLQDKAQCENFFEHFLSAEYQQLKKERNMVYFRKIGAYVHEGKGVFPVNDKEEKYIKELYDDGRKCGTVRNNNLIQMNIHNLLLVENRKFGFRSFMLVASTNPLIAYYHDGYARLSLNSYDTQSNDTSTFVTNIGVNLKNTEFGNWTEQEIQDFTYWPLEKFNSWVNERGLVDDPDWINNYLRPEFMKVKVHLLRMSQSGFFKISSMFELYGIDYVMDENLQLWFIEANARPLVNGFTEHSTQLFNQMLMDTFDIVQGLIRSRMKRAILYVNKLVKVYEDGEIPDLAEKQQVFKGLTMNRFEPEFEPRRNNTFVKIVDENLDGIERYSGLVDFECLGL